MEAERETALKERIVGRCRCNGNLMIKKSRYGRFIACDKFPNCKIIFKLPPKGNIKTSDKICKECSSPVIYIGKKEVCINNECPSKRINEVYEDKKCPKCSKNLVLRKSIYGSFYGCSDYPKCRYIEKIK